MDTLQIQQGDAIAEFSLFGGQLLRWHARGRERLFLSPRAQLDGRAPIRGGAPVIFPQFNARGPYPRHGFARTRAWQLREQAADHLVLVLGDDAETLSLWPHRFELRLLARISADALTLTLEVENTDAQAFEFSCALHTYFACSLAETRVSGLQHCGFEEDGAWHPPAAGARLRPAPPLDRIYRGPAPNLQLQSGAEILAMQAAGFRDWVVWNPGRSGAEALADLGGAVSDAFLCIEPGCIFEPIPLAPGERWRGTLQLGLGEDAPQGSHRLHA